MASSPTTSLHEQHIAKEVSTEALEYSEQGRASGDARRPLPSKDPNDPLNWPTSEKLMTYSTICFFAFLATVNTSKFTVAILPLAKEFKKDTNTTAYLVSFSVLALGLGNLIWVTMLRTLGRRPTFLLAIPLMAAGNLWSAVAQSFGSLLGATIIASIAAGAGEAPISAVVADLFFVQQRGTMMMIFHLSLSGGFFVGPAINAALSEFVGWRWICGWIAIASCVTWVFGIFSIHETAYYHRDVNLPHSHYGPKKTFVQQLALHSGYNKDLSVFTALYNTVAVATYPPIFWAGLTVGCFVGWNIIAQLTASRLMSIAPYHFALYKIGLVFISGFIGALVAMYLGGILIDTISNRMTVKAHGQREAEYRLPALLIPAVIGPMGILIFGLCLAHRVAWIGPTFGFGMQGFGLTAASNVLVTYAVDSYLSLAGEVLVVVFLIRGVSGCLLSLYAYDWILAAGVSDTFGQMVGVQCFLLLFGIGFYIWGKRIRGWTSRYGPLKHVSAY